MAAKQQQNHCWKRKNQYQDNEKLNIPDSTKSKKNNLFGMDPLYRKVCDHIRKCILQGVLRKRVIITESAISRIFDISRTPARQALLQLQEERLIQRRPSRGYVVGTHTDGPLHKLTPDMLHFPLGDDFTHPAKEWNNIYDAIESEVIRQSILSACRINARLLSKYYSCSRSAIKEILYKLEVSGLVQRKHQSRWNIVHLDERRLDAIFEVRSWLEPNLLAQAIPRIPEDILQKVIDRHNHVLSRFPETTGAELNELEIDMHDGLLQYADNKVGIVALQSAKAGLISSKHIVASKEVPLENDEPFLEEHLDILEAIYRRNPNESSLRLQAHLLKSRNKVRDRLRKFRSVVQANPKQFIKPWAL